MRIYRSSIAEGMVAGMVGAAGVAFWFLIFDGIQGRPLFTPAALGSALFLGASSVAEVAISLPVVLGYSAIHLAAFVAVGVLAALLARATERNPPMLLAGVLLFVTLEVFFIGMIALLAGWLLNVMPWWPIAVANLLAALLMGFYLWRAHPILRARDLAGLEEPEMASAEGAAAWQVRHGGARRAS